ncbi:hypothetical protein [Vibrio jasicida]|uniref:hypothetical protein n=1 Tax=Vibrio jasicida TaxID=766224 RepID=UPI000CE56F56|nr:hypothetical protein [Vibrio jasicida]
MLKTMKSVSVIGVMVMAAQVAASPTFHVDTLFKSSNKNGNEIFTVSNQGREALYLNSEVLRIELHDGEIKKVPLTRDNFPLWDLAVNPTKAVLQVGEVRDFTVKYLCETNCDRSEDLVYQVRFFPSTEVDGKQGQQVNFLFGMAPYYVIPALEQKVDYQWDYQASKRQIEVTNTGNTFIKVELSQCHEQQSAKEKAQCRVVHHILAQRHKVITLPETFDDAPVSVRVANHDQSIEKTFNL